MSVQSPQFRMLVPSIIERNRIAHHMLDLRMFDLSYAAITKVIALEEGVMLTEAQARLECRRLGAPPDRRRPRSFA